LLFTRFQTRSMLMKLNKVGVEGEGIVGLQSDSEGSLPRIIFGSSENPVLNAQGKSATTNAAGAYSQIPTCPRSGSEIAPGRGGKSHA